MYIRSRRSYRLNSLLPLALLVCVGVVVTTIVQAADNPGTASGNLLMDAQARAEQVPTQGPKQLSHRAWLLPNGVVSSFSRGMYHMQLNNTGGHRGASLARNLAVILSVGYSDDDRPVSSPAERLRAQRNGLQGIREAGPAMFMSVGSQW